MKNRRLFVISPHLFGVRSDVKYKSFTEWGCPLYRGSEVEVLCEHAAVDLTL